MWGFLLELRVALAFREWGVEDEGEFVVVKARNGGDC